MKQLLIIVLLLALASSQTTGSEDEANLRKEISLSFRQVNSFNLGDLSFKFFAFTSQVISDSNFTVLLSIYYLKDLEKNQSPKFATCFIENTVTTISELGIEPVSFNCQFPNETDFTSIEISSSESVAGLPLDKNLLNPVLVDKAIDEGKLFNASEIGSELSIAEIQEFNFDTVQEDGIFYIKANVAGSFISEGQTFDIQLAYPSGFNINFTITHFNGSMLEMKCEIEGEIENQYLISEQTLITINGTELFVLPGFKTENPISTSNNNLPSREENEEEETSEKKQKEATENEVGLEDETSDKEGKEEAEIESALEEETSEKEQKETSDKEGALEKETSDKKEDYSEEEEEGEEESLEFEEANLRKEISLSFRQVNSFNLGDLSFKFFAFTSQPILDPNFEIQLLIYLLQGTARFKSPVIATCHIVDIVSKISELGIEPVSFNCQFPNETDFTSIEISSSESVAGLPLDKNLLNPVLVDKAIAEGKLFNASEIGSEFSILGNQEFNFDTVQEDGIFYIKANVAGSFISEGQTFDIQLAYPIGIIIRFTIIHYDGTLLDMKCEIRGKIEN